MFSRQDSAILPGLILVLYMYFTFPFSLTLWYQVMEMHSCKRKLEISRIQSGLVSSPSVLLFKSSDQGSKKTPSGRPGLVDFPFGQVTYSPSLPHGQGPRQAVRQLNFGNDFEKKSKVIKCLDEE